MIKLFKSIYTTPSAIELIERELEDAILSKLIAETALDYAVSVVEYNTARIKRLEARKASYL
jgi:hypothetical protein